MMIAIWAVTVGSLLTLIAVHVLYWMDAREVRRDTSRFKMFAVRDRLVWLVATGEMREDDPAWQLMYSATNNMLDLRYKGTLLGCMLDDARTARRVVEDPKFRARVEATGALLKEAEQRSPGFSQLMLLVDKAFASMRRERTPTWQWWLLIALVIVIAPYTILHRAVREAFFHKDKGRTHSTAAVAVFAQRAQGSGQNPRMAIA